VLSSNVGLSNPIQDNSSSKTFGNLSTNAELNPNLLSSPETLYENLDINTSGTAKLCEEHELVNIFAARHPNIEEFSTYIRGTKRMDYYLVSRDIIPAVTAAGYKPYHYCTTSDHRGLFLDLDVGTLFENATTALAAQPFRDLRSKDLQSNTTYIDASSAHLNSNHLFQNLTTLLTTRDDALAVRLDNLLVQACQHGEKQCRK
jgi:hypothetical protein